MAVQFICEQIKLQKTCADCYENRPWLLQFAHFSRDNKLKTDIRKLSLHELSLEMAKGRFLCIFCHREETKREWDTITYKSYISKKKLCSDTINILKKRKKDDYRKCTGHFCKGSYKHISTFYLKDRSCRLDNVCKDCKWFDATTRRHKKAQLINEYKVNIGKCITCGFQCNDSNYYLFDFDHVSPADKFKSVSDMKQYSTDRIIQEIKKCELKCCKCHVSKHRGILNYS